MSSKKKGLKIKEVSKHSEYSGINQNQYPYSRFVVRFNEGRNLLASDITTGKSDPVCFVWCGPKDITPDPDDEDCSILRTKVCKTTIDPIWNEEMVFPLDVSDLITISEMKCLIYVRDEDDVEDNPDLKTYDELGMLNISLKDLIFKGKLLKESFVKSADWYTLQLTPKTKQNPLGMRNVDGSIKLTISLIFAPEDFEIISKQVSAGGTLDIGKTITGKPMISIAQQVQNYIKRDPNENNNITTNKNGLDPRLKLSLTGIPRPASASSSRSTSRSNLALTNVAPMVKRPNTASPIRKKDKLLLENNIISSNNNEEVILEEDEEDDVQNENQTISEEIEELNVVVKESSSDYRKDIRVKLDNMDMSDLLNVDPDAGDQVEFIEDLVKIGLRVSMEAANDLGQDFYQDNLHDAVAYSAVEMAHMAKKAASKLAKHTAKGITYYDMLENIKTSSKETGSLIGNSLENSAKNVGNSISKGFSGATKGVTKIMNENSKAITNYNENDSPEQLLFDPFANAYSGDQNINPGEEIDIDGSIESKTVKHTEISDKTQPTVKPTEISDKTQPTVKPTEISDKTQPTVKPTEISDKTQPTVKPTEISDKTQPTVKPTEISDKIQPTVKPTEISDKTQPTVKPTEISDKIQPTVKPTEISDKTQPTVKPTEISDKTQPTVSNVNGVPNQGLIDSSSNNSNTNLNEIVSSNTGHTMAVVRALKEMSLQHRSFEQNIEKIAEVTAKGFSKLSDRIITLENNLKKSQDAKNNILELEDIDDSNTYNAEHEKVGTKRNLSRTSPVKLQDKDIKLQKVNSNTKENKFGSLYAISKAKKIAVTTRKDQITKSLQPSKPIYQPYATFSEENNNNNYNNNNYNNNNNNNSKNKSLRSPIRSNFEPAMQLVYKDTEGRVASTQVDSKGQERAQTLPAIDQHHRSYNQNQQNSSYQGPSSISNDNQSGRSYNNSYNSGQEYYQQGKAIQYPSYSNNHSSPTTGLQIHNKYPLNKDFHEVLERGSLEDVARLLESTAPKPEDVSASVRNRLYDAVATILHHNNPLYMERCLIWTLALVRGNQQLIDELAGHTRRDLKEALEKVALEPSKRGLLASLLKSQINQKL